MQNLVNMYGRFSSPDVVICRLVGCLLHMGFIHIGSQIQTDVLLYLDCCINNFSTCYKTNRRKPHFRRN